LLVRADAGSQIGTGHLMRSLALARAWESAGGRVTFASCCEVEPLRERIRASGARLASLGHPHPDPADLAVTLALLAEAKSENAPPAPTWVALDGYQFDSTYQQAVRDAGARLLVIDAVAHLGQYHPDVLLNQNWAPSGSTTRATPTRYCCWAVIMHCCGRSSSGGPPSSE